MSYDYVIWKRAPGIKTAMLADVYQSICEGKDHPAMAPFDTAVVERDLISEFGDVNNDPDGPFLYGVDRGSVSPWLTINVGYSQVEAVTDKLARLAIQHGLMLYDPQRDVVWGNKRV